MKRLILAVFLAACVLAPAASAHRIPRADAESRWYYVFNDRCGNENGSAPPSCLDRKVSLRCNETPGRPHAWSCSYEFREWKPRVPFVVPYHTRYCTVYGVLVHSTVDSWNESCTGWS